MFPVRVDEVAIHQFGSDAEAQPSDKYSGDEEELDDKLFLAQFMFSQAIEELI